MLITTDFYEPAELTGYARAALALRQVNQPGLAQWLPNRTIDDLVYRFSRGGQGLTEAAVYRAWDTPATISARNGFDRVTGELPPISRSTRLDEYTRLRDRANGDLANSVREAIETDAEKLVREILMRVEVARAQALVTGTFTLEGENGLYASVDFGRSSSMSVAPTTLWSDKANADPLVDLRTWADAYEDENGVSPGAIVVSSRVYNAALSADATRERLVSVVGVPGDVTRDQFSAMLTARDLPPVYTYNLRYSVNGVATRPLPDDKLLLLPPRVDTDDFAGTDLGATVWGRTAESYEPNYGLADGSDAAGVVVGSYSEQNPVTLWTVASAVVMPVLTNPNLSMVADVL